MIQEYQKYIDVLIKFGNKFLLSQEWPKPEEPVKKDYELKWEELDREEVLRILCDKHDFSRQRTEDTLDRLDKAQSQMSQKGLGEFF